MKELFAEDYNSIKLLFTPWKSAKEAAHIISNLLSEVKAHYLNSESNSYKSLELEYLEVLIRNFNHVNDFINKYSYFDSLRSFRILFSQIVGTSSAAFLGEPLKGLQIMGVLETQTLDFKNVIFVSVNEGVFPLLEPESASTVTREDMLDPDFKMKVIADITCDINGSVPSTKRASTIPDPLYDYDPATDSVLPALSDERYITTMAVDNLPCELPRSASEEFGRDLIDRILKPLLVGDVDGIIKRGTVAEEGVLTEEFNYLQDYIEPNKKIITFGHVIV